MALRSNRAKKLVSRGASISKLMFPHSHHLPTIFIRSKIAKGIAPAIGRDHEIELTLDQAISLRADLDRVIEDVKYHLNPGGKR